MGVEERLVLQLEHGQVDSRGHGLDPGRYLVAGQVALDLYLGRVEDDMGIREDAPALDHDPGSGDVLRRALRPRPEQVRRPGAREDLDHGIAGIPRARVGAQRQEDRQDEGKGREGLFHRGWRQR
jgi:hypothetical protein